MKLENWTPYHNKSDSKYCWRHDNLDIEARIYKYRDGETYELDNGQVRDFVWVAEVIEEEIGSTESNVFLFKDHGNNVEELHDRVTEFLGNHPYRNKCHVMDDYSAVDLLVDSIYTGYPFVEPDGRMPEERDGSGEFTPGITVQGHTGTLGYPDWGVLNKIDDHRIRKGYYTEHRDVHGDAYVIVGTDRDDVEAIKEGMEGLDEREMEGETVDQIDYEMLFENAEERGVKIQQYGYRQPATVHEGHEKSIVAVDNTAYVSEEV